MKTSVLAFSCLSLALALSPLSAGCAAAAEQESASSGDAISTVGLARENGGFVGDANIMARLEVATDSGTPVVTGSYFYVGRPTKGEQITLKGTIDGDSVTLDEMTLGQKTGSFVGTLRNGIIRGSWTKPDGSGQLPFTMWAITPGSPFTVERAIKDTAPAVEASGEQKTCDLDATYLEVYGAEDPLVEGLVNAALMVSPIKKNKDGKCEEAESDNVGQKQKFLAKNVLVVESIDSWFGGGAHPLNSLTWKNISLKTGNVLGAKDIFKADAKAAVLAMLVKGIEARADLEKEDRDYLIEQANLGFEDKDAFASLDYCATADGIRISLFNWLAHAAQAVDVDGTLLPWRDVKPLLVPGTEIATLSPVE
jgi:hypothetical protein